MQRNEFLYLAQECSTLPEFCGTKQNVPDKLKVIYQNVQYYPVAYTISFDKQGNTQHIATLHDLKVNSIIECNLERVNKYEH